MPVMASLDCYINLISSYITVSSFHLPGFFSKCLNHWSTFCSFWHRHFLSCFHVVNEISQWILKQRIWVSRTSRHLKVIISPQHKITSTSIWAVQCSLFEYKCYYNISSPGEKQSLIVYLSCCTDFEVMWFEPFETQLCTFIWRHDVVKSNASIDFNDKCQIQFKLSEVCLHSA